MKVKDVVEAVIDAAVQGRMPVSSGSLGLMTSRADFGHAIHKDTNILIGAADKLADLLKTAGNHEQAFMDVVRDFRVKEHELLRAFSSRYGCSPEKYLKKTQKELATSPKKV